MEEAALLRGAVPVMVYAPEEVAFGAIIDATPRRLKELGLYGPLAIEWRDGAHRAVSAQLVALALGATTGDVCDVGTWAVARVKRLWAARRPRRSACASSGTSTSRAAASRAGSSTRSPTRSRRAAAGPRRGEAL